MTATLRIGRHDVGDDTPCRVIAKIGCSRLHCTARYPELFEELELRIIEQYRERLPGATISFSGHDNGIAVPLYEDDFRSFEMRSEPNPELARS